MARRAFMLLSMFAVTTNHVHSQFFDIFQGFQPYLHNLQSSRRPDFNIYPQDVTRQRPKDGSYVRGDDSSSDEQILPQLSNDKEYSRTTKPPRRRKTTTTDLFNFNIFTTPKPIKKNKNNSSHRTINDYNKKNQELLASSNRRQYYDDEANNVADYNTRPSSVTTRPVYAITRTTARPNYANTRPATTRPNYLTTKNYYDNSVPEYNSYTTQNPLYNRPGVKPAVVDSNKPPITNRPATTKPINSRPIDTRPENPRPVNTRPISRPATIRPAATTRPFAVYPKPTDSSAIKYPEDPDTSPEMVTGPDEDKMSSVERRRYIDLAEKMCDKYKALSIKKVEAIPLVPSPEPVRVNVSVCAPTNVPLVVGGKVVTIEEFPHMALLGWTRLQGGGYSWKCGGSLISEQYVLTAGHCAYQEKDDSVVMGAPRVVQLGSNYLDDTGALVMRVLFVVTHPKYIQTRSYYDIALVKMVKPVTFSQVVRPACLGEPPGVGEPIIATGWGRTEFGGSQSLELRSVSIPVWDINECSRVLGTSRKLPEGPSRDSQICAGEKNGGKDTCQGDSGGPAQIQDGCAWRVVAVTSVGRSCGAPNTPALYATLHRAFIAAQIFGKTSTASQNNQNNPRPATVINNWDRRDENNDNRDTYTGNNNNQNKWNTNQNSDRRNNNNGVNNQNWNNNQENNNRHINQNNNGYTNSNNQNSPNNRPTESSIYSHNNRQQFNSNGNNNENYNDHRIVYPEDSYDANINHNSGVHSYTTHRPAYNNGWWSGFGY